MKLLSVGLARALWFVDIAELNPGGRDMFVDLIPSLVEDYKFKAYPKSGQEDLTQGMKLTGGEFAKKDGKVLVLNVTVYNDGIAADTYCSTDDSDEFLGTVLTALPDFGFAFDPEMVRRKAYVSQLHVKCAKRLSALNPRLVEFANRLSLMVSGTTYDTAALELWSDQTQVMRPANFSFQRKLGDPADTDRYWSQAALPTAEHLNILEEFEAILS